MAGKYLDEVPERKEFIKKHALKDIKVARNMKEHPVHARKIRGNAGAYFEFKDMQVLDSHMSEIVPGGKSQKHRHSNEAIITIVAGKGYSVLQKEGEPEQKIDWAEGDLMAIPAYYWHQHFNSDSQKPARYLAIKNVPLLEKMGLFVVEQSLDK